MGVAAFGVVGGYHIGCHGLSKTAWTGDATIAVPSIYPVIKNLDQHRFIYIEIIVNIFCKVFCPRIYICSHVFLS